ncbi:V-type ATPase subunit [Acidianus brierleyi]|uniref:ATPase n=1 Tax=Acidianus brierleyi TaxID=41673 RepID=A0A2U9IES5_9CREN|nr:V-type ATPase subunit [Acidianus brierleyi]AWR94547.1 ATPase [Acidianus brierleyi]
MSSASLAYLSSISRNFKSKTLTKGLINELLAETEWKNAVNILKERGYFEEVSYNFDDMEYLIKSNAIQNLLLLMNLSMSVKTSYYIASLYYYILTLDEFENIISAIYNKVNIQNTRIFQKIMESKPENLNELVNLIRDSIHGKALQYALSKNPHDLSQLNSYLDYYFILELSKTIEGLRGDWKASADSIVCGYKDYYTVSMAIRQKTQENVVCKVSLDVIKDLVNSRSSTETIDILRRISYARSMEFTNVYSALSSLYREVRVLARKNALNAFMGSPFTPVTVLGISEILRLDKEDLISILNGIKLKMNPDKIKSKLSFEMV